MFQDNMSAMLLEKHGRGTSTERTKNIRVRYFLIKDRIVVGDMEVDHCPTGEMLADHSTKPLQGAPFRKFRTQIQVIPDKLPELDMAWGEREDAAIPIP